MFGIIDLVVLAFLALLVIALISMVKIVPQGFHYTVERLGRFDRTLKPGLSVLWPFVETIGSKMDMREQVLDVPTQEVITKDNATCEVDGVTFYQVLDAAKATYEVSGLQNAVLNLTMTNLRTVMGSMDLDELLSKRDEINTRILRVVDQAVEPWGIKMTRIEIKDINPPRNLVDSMARQMMAEREKRALVLEASGTREAAILRAQGEKESQILKAEGEKEAAFRESEAREREAQAEAEATRMVSEAIGAGNSAAINYFVAQKYTEALMAIGTAKNQKIIMLPLEATALMGSLAGIGEIAKDVFGTDGDPPAEKPARSVPRTLARATRITPPTEGA
ncbi:SPFH/Band 7/PHB domain protein [Rhizobiaceae bacterium]|nr:SPFH/Band 7/PHB domain protein [Rhizobiaceae bacterium]